MDAQGVSGQVLDQLVRSEVLMLGGSVYVGAMARALKIEVSAVYGALGELVKLGWVLAPGDLQRRLGRPQVTSMGYQVWMAAGVPDLSRHFETVKQVVLSDVEQNTTSVKATTLRHKLRKQHDLTLTEDEVQIDLRLMRGAGWITTHPMLGLHITSYAGALYPGVPLAHWHLPDAQQP